MTVLACAAGNVTPSQIAAELGCNAVMVGKWRHRFGETRLDGLVDARVPMRCAPSVTT